MVGFAQPGSHDAVMLAAALEVVRRSVCAYSMGQLDRDVRCDCKYGAGRRVTDGESYTLGSEKTGCPELREVITGLLQGGDPETVPISEHSEALDEIYRLRAAAAVDARVIETLFDYRTLPKAAKQKLTDVVNRLRAAARGDAERAYAGFNSRSRTFALESAGTNGFLNRHSFKAERERKKTI